MAVRDSDFEYDCPRCHVDFDTHGELVEHLKWDHNYRHEHAESAARKAVKTDGGETDGEGGGGSIPLFKGTIVASIPYLISLYALDAGLAPPHAVMLGATAGLVVGVVVGVNATVDATQ